MIHLNFQSIFIGPENVLWFALGVISVQVWQVIKAKYKDYKDPDHTPHPFKRVNWLYVAIAMTWMISIFIGVDNQRTYNFAANVAKDVQRCQAEFQQALKYRSDLVDSDRKLGSLWQQKTLDHLARISNPPADIARLAPEDPKRLEYDDNEDDRYFAEVTELEIQRRVNELQRQANPLPDPTCGIGVK